MPKRGLPIPSGQPNLEPRRQAQSQRIGNRQMSFRDKEKARQTALKGGLFSAGAEAHGTYLGRSYSFCIGGQLAGENLHADHRQRAITYFRERGIGWHGGERGGYASDLPSRHLCCSQSMCVNVLFPFMYQPVALKRTLIDLGYSVSEVLSFAPDEANHKEPGYIVFEWIGLCNYLGEHSRGRIATDGERKRGAGFTSADFAVRFMRDDGRVQIVLGEWKYTEFYISKSIQKSRNGTDRLEIYSKLLSRSDCPIGHAGVGMEALFFEPFDQLMRLQLLAFEMERCRELDADYVSVLHVAPYQNQELMRVIGSPKLRPLGDDIHSVWSTLVSCGRFKGVSMKELLASAVRHQSSFGLSSGKYIEERYSGMCAQGSAQKVHGI